MCVCEYAHGELKAKTRYSISILLTLLVPFSQLHSRLCLCVCVGVCACKCVFVYGYCLDVSVCVCV